MAAPGHAVTVRGAGDQMPPAWAESTLRALLPPRDRDTVSGDLLEEYRQVVVPSRGDLFARLWYVRQVASFVTFARLTRALIGWLEEGDAMLEKSVRRHDGSLWRLVLVCGLLVTAVLVARLLFDIWDPADPVERLLAHARDDYSEFDYPRRWVPVAALAAVLMGSGLLATWRTGRIRSGTLSAAASAAAGSAVYLALVVIGNAWVPGPRQPVILIPILVVSSTVLGTIGALFGRSLGAPNSSDIHG